MVFLYYSAHAHSESQVRQIAESLRSQPYPKVMVDFPFDDRWTAPGYRHRDDYNENWTKYGLCSFARLVQDEWRELLPDHYKGAVISIDDGCDPLWLAFGKYRIDWWACEHFTRTFNASSGFHAHIRAVELLRTLADQVDELHVIDETGLWETRDLEKAFQAYRDGFYRLRALSRTLQMAQMEYGLRPSPLDDALAPKKRTTEDASP